MRIKYPSGPFGTSRYLRTQNYLSLTPSTSSIIQTESASAMCLMTTGMCIMPFNLVKRLLPSSIFPKTIRPRTLRFTKAERVGSMQSRMSNGL